MNMGRINSFVLTNRDSLGRMNGIVLRTLKVAKSGVHVLGVTYLPIDNFRAVPRMVKNCTSYVDFTLLKHSR